jgi:hypothetical protein
MAVAPTSHNFRTELNLDTHIDTLPLGSTFKESSQLRSFHRETVSEVLEKHSITPGSDAAQEMLEAAGHALRKNPAVQAAWQAGTNAACWYTRFDGSPVSP